MKGLLQSKKFKDNLKKWLLVYIGVMLLLTTVITYSKYISKFLNDEEARPARFNVYIKPISCRADACKSGTYLEPEEENGKLNINYYFSVDTTELEATADLYLSVVALDGMFDIEKLEVINQDKSTKELICSNNMEDNASPCVATSGKYTTLKTIETKERALTYYAVTVSYKGNDNLYEEDSDDVIMEHDYSDAIKIWYSAIQKTDTN